MSEQSKLVVRRAVEEVWNQGNLDAVDDIVAGDFVAHAPPGETHGREDMKSFYGALHEAFPDIHFTIEDQIAEADTVVTRWTARATHTGTFQGVPATGKPVVVTGIDIDRVAGGKVVECWFDALGMLRQLGVLPAEGTP